jgi:hypothetical protein
MTDQLLDRLVLAERQVESILRQLTEARKLVESTVKTDVGTACQGSGVQAPGSDARKADTIDWQPVPQGQGAIRASIGDYECVVSGDGMGRFGAWLTPRRWNTFEEAKAAAVRRARGEQ